MGNTENKGNDSYFMNIKIIGLNIKNFYKEIKSTEESIKNYGILSLLKKIMI